MWTETKENTHADHRNDFIQSGFYKHIFHIHLFIDPISSTFTGIRQGFHGNHSILHRHAQQINTLK